MAGSGQEVVSDGNETINSADNSKWGLQIPSLQQVTPDDGGLLRALMYGPREVGIDAETPRVRAMGAVLSDETPSLHMGGAAPRRVLDAQVFVQAVPLPVQEGLIRTLRVEPVLHLWPPDQRATTAFLAGFRAAGGPSELERHFVERVIPLCEWTLGWGVPWYPGNGYLSVAQFHPDTWARAGGGDPNDSWTVGRNVANWLNTGIDPGGTGGWPTCFWR